MIQDLPRQLLWTDLTNYSEVKSNKLCNLVDALLTLDPPNSKLMSDLGEETVLLLYNEAFYLCTRIIYEKKAEAHPEAYMEKIQSDLGDEKLAKSVITLMFYVLWQQSDKSDEVIRFTDKLQKKYLSHPSSRLLNWLNKLFKIGKNRDCYKLKPCPYPADKLQDFHLDWSKITHGFSRHIINEILDLWDSEEERNKVIKIIENTRTSCLSELKDNASIGIKAPQGVDPITFSVESYFPNNNTFVREGVKTLVKEFYLSEAANLFLIEIVLFYNDLLKKRNHHMALVKILKCWGALPNDLNEGLTANGMSAKMCQLKRKQEETALKHYNEWDEKLYERQTCFKIENRLSQLMNYNRKE